MYPVAAARHHLDVAPASVIGRALLFSQRVNYRQGAVQVVLLVWVAVLVDHYTWSLAVEVVVALPLQYRLPLCHPVAAVVVLGLVVAAEVALWDHSIYAWDLLHHCDNWDM